MELFLPKCQWHTSSLKLKVRFQKAGESPLSGGLGYNIYMAKTKMVVKEDQILVDVEMIFKEIEAAGGDWKKVWEEFKAYLKQVKGE